MWAVTRDLTVNKVNVLYDTDSNQVTHYSFKDSDMWYAMTDDFVNVFESEEGAKNYRMGASPLLHPDGESQDD